jgi:peroxiredoxin Q/BCP
MSEPSPLTEGDPAPDFDLETDDGRVRLADLRGKLVVLYFYPRDDTPGCTAEAIAFSAHRTRFEDIGAIVVGVSKDPPKSHAKFKAKYDLNLVLGSEPETAVLERYGAWVEKSMYGRKYMGIDRSTFLIDRDGRVARAWRKVKVNGHADEVLKAAEAIA